MKWKTYWLAICAVLIVVFGCLLVVDEARPRADRFRLAEVRVTYNATLAENQDWGCHYAYRDTARPRPPQSLEVTETETTATFTAAPEGYTQRSLLIDGAQWSGLGIFTVVMALVWRTRSGYLD